MFRKTLSLTTALLSACVATDARDSSEVVDPAQTTDVGAVGTIRPALACSTYTVVDLGLPAASGGGGATAIDDAGNVAGTYNPTTVAIGHAFQWTAAGGLVDLGTLGGSYSSSHAISGARVAGESTLSSGDSHAFLHDATGLHDLGTLGGGGIDASAAYGVNATGVIVGKSRLANGFLHAAQFSATAAATDLGTLVGTATSNSSALAITGSIIVGSSDTTSGGTHAAIWSGGTITDLGSIGTDTSVANAVNASGAAAGNILHSFVPRPAVFSGGTVTLVPIVSGFESANATGINSAGLVVGTMTHSPGGEVPSIQHGYVYDGTSSFDLNTLVGPGWTVTNAVAINTSGWIAGTAVSTSTMMGADHRSHPVIIKPTCGTTKAFRAASTATKTTTAAKPTGTVAGDFLLAALEVDADPASITPPAGWTLVRDQLAGSGASIYHALVYSHVATGGEPASYTFAAPAGVYVDIQIAAYQGITAVDAVASTSATGGSIAAPSVTTTGAGEILVTIFEDFEGGTWSTASGMTLRTNFDSNSLQDQARPTAGATGTRTATDAAGALAAFSIALK
ncbi:MAG TPA: hypothetical protein VGC42_10240 [Kofleriaceae bacterium]